MRVDCKRAGKSGGQTRSGSETAPLKPKDGLSGPPAILRCSVTYIFTGVPLLATHCHCPFGIFTHVSVQRSSKVRGLPDASVALALKPPVAMAVSPKTLTFRLLYSALLHFVAFAVANVPALPVTLPSFDVSTKFSASSGASRSGLFVFCD